MSQSNTKLLINNEFGTGYLPDLGDFRDFTKMTMMTPQKLEEPKTKEIAELFANKVAIDDVNVLPPTFDFSYLMPPVRNQGSLGSCTAFALDGLVSYFNKQVNNKTIQTSTLYTYKKERDLDKSVGDAGSYLRTAMKCLKLYGWIEEKRYQYVQTKYDNSIPRDLIDYGLENQAISYIRIDSAQQKLDTLVTEMKKYLVKKIPLMFGFSVFSSIDQANTNGGIIPYPEPNEQLLGGHAIVLTGFDDNIIIKNKNNPSKAVKGGFIFRNSWSDRWGKKGYGIIPQIFFKDQIAMDVWGLLNLEFLDWSVFD